MLVVWTRLPEVPVTVTVDTPDGAFCAAVRVRIDVALPPIGGVMGLGAKEAVTPFGSPEALRVLAALNPLRLVTVIVLVPNPPAGIVSDAGGAAMEKSGAGGPPHVENLNEAMRVLQLKVPLVLRYSCVYQKVQSSLGSIVMLL